MKPKMKQQQILTIYLQKVAKGLVWDTPLCGHLYHHRHHTQTTHTHHQLPPPTNHNHNNHHHNNLIPTLDPISIQLVQKELLLERFQEENPGMDFRDATMNGSIPDPRTYMGGIGYQ